MTPAKSIDSTPEAASAKPVAQPAATPSRRLVYGEYLLRFMVIAFGIVAGLIVAAIVGLFLGLITISC